MKLHPLVLALGLTPLAGCGGGSSSETTSAPITPEKEVTYSVRAVDGYLQNALVWLDINGNFALDDGEPNKRSGVDGITLLDVSNIANPQNYQVIVKAIPSETVDQDSFSSANPNGIATTVPFILSAPAGQTVVTPLSTLVNIKIINGTDPAQATAEVAADLGITETDLLGDYIAQKQGDIAAKANAIVELAVLPESEQAMQVIKENSSAFDTLLSADIAIVQELKEDQRLVKEENGTLTVAINVDADDDGVIDAKDAFPNDKTEWLDTDKDGSGNNADLDDDADDVNDIDDAFPLNSKESTDTDADGMGDNADTDDDGDQVLDANDAFPLDKTETLDTDGDGTGNNADTDDDGDKVLDANDAFPLDKTETLDTDADGTGNNADTDDDGDKVLDANDAFPSDATETTDTDGDGTGDNADLDDDGDGVLDTDEDNSALIGTWSNLSISFTFNNDMTYSMEQKTSDDEASDSTTGTETGVYTYDESTGAISVSNITSDNNGTSGLSDMLDPTSTLSFSLADAEPSANNLTFNYDEGDEQGTFVLYKTLATNASDYIITNPNFAFFDYEDTDFGYDDVNWNSTDNSLTSTAYQFNNKTQGFDFAADESTDYVLTSNGWGYADEGNETLISQTDGSIIYRNNYETETGTGQEWLLSDANISQFIAAISDQDSLVSIFDDSVSFSEGASAYETTWTSAASTPVYSLYLSSCEQPGGYTDLPLIKVADTGLCNESIRTMTETVAWNAATETIAQITTNTHFATGMDPNLFAGMYFNNYAIRLVEDGTVDIYSLKWGEACSDELGCDGVNQTSTQISGVVNWKTVTVNEATLITFSTDELDLSDFNRLFLTEIGGYVRTGEIQGSDDEDNDAELIFNDIAKQDILDAITPSNISTSIPLTALIGSWSNADVSFLFNNDMSYIMEQKTDDSVPDSWAGTESGTYSYNPDTGAITVTAINDDKNGTSGLSDYLNNPNNAFVLTSYEANNSLTFTYIDGDESGEFTLNAVTSTAPAKFSTEYLAGKTFYQVWFGDGDKVNENGVEIDLEDVAVVQELTFTADPSVSYDDYLGVTHLADGTLAVTGIQNTTGIPAGEVYPYLVDSNGILRFTDEQDSMSEGNIICDNSHPDYLKTNFLLNSNVDNVELFFFDKQKALDFANGLTASIPACSL